MKKKTIINRDLAKKMGADEKKIQKIHRKRERLFKKAEKENDHKTMSNLVKELEQIEFELQRAWGFSEDAKFHTWWYKIPKCTCPKMDNADVTGVDLRYISENCPYHGNYHAKQNKQKIYN